MIRRETVFILGAGCSMPYNFPSGSELVKEIIEVALARPTPETFNYAGFKNEDVQRFGSDLRNSDMPSIDTFLAYRPEFVAIGKLAIAICMTLRENDDTLAKAYRGPGSNSLWQQTWYHYLWNEMATQKGEFGNNKIAFVTFNYDRSLERYFFLRLRALHSYANDTEIFDDLYRIRFVHIHGSLGDERFEEYRYQNKVRSHDMLKNVAARLKIIHEGRDGNPNFAEAIELMHKARCICFLGYGFHDLNNKGLQLATIANGSDKLWYASRFGMTEVEFRRRVSEFYGVFNRTTRLSDRVGDESDTALDVLRKLRVI